MNDYIENRKKYPNAYKIACELARLPNPQAVIELISKQCSDDRNKRIGFDGVNVIIGTDKPTTN